MSSIPILSGSANRELTTDLRLAAGKQIRFRGDIHLKNGIGGKVKITSVPAATSSLPKILSYNPTTFEVYYQNAPVGGDGGADLTEITTDILNLQNDLSTVQNDLNSKVSSTYIVGVEQTIQGIENDLEEVHIALTGKASATAITDLTGQFTGLTTYVNTFGSTLAGKANQADVSTLQTSVSGLQTSVSGLQTTVSGKADQSSVSSLGTTVSNLASAVSTLQNASSSSTVANDISSLQQSATSLQNQITAIDTIIDGHTTTLSTVATQDDTDALSQSIIDLGQQVSAKADSSTLTSLQTTVASKLSSISSGSANITVSTATPTNPIITLSPTPAITTLTVSRTTGTDNQNSTICKIGAQNKVLDFYPYFSSKGQQSGSMLQSDYALLVSDNGGSKNNNSTLFVGSWNNNGGIHIAANGDCYFHGQNYYTHQYVKQFVLRPNKVTLLSQGLDGVLTGGAAAPKHSLEAWIDSTTKRLYFGWNNASSRVFSGWCKADVNGTETTTGIISQTFSSTSNYPQSSAFASVTVGNMTKFTVCLYTDNGTEAYEINATVLSPGSSTIKDYISIEKLI